MFGKEPYPTIRRDHIVSKVYSDFSSALTALTDCLSTHRRGERKRGPLGIPVSQ